MLEDRVYTFNKYLKEKFGERTARISFDIESPCPWGKCIFCNHSSFVPFNAVRIREDDWFQQYEKVSSYMKKRYETESFIAYFQNNTSTYGDLEELIKLYKRAVTLPGIKGLIISTRPDYINAEIIEKIYDISKELTDCWIELGLQSVHEKSLEFIKRGHTAETYFEALEIIDKYSNSTIKVAPHIILGIPGESYDFYAETVTKALNHKIAKGIKFHHLQIHKNTELAEIFEKSHFETMSAESYIETVASLLRIIPKTTVIFRLFTTTPGSYLIAPRWNLKTQDMLEKLNNYMELNNIYQGDAYDAE